MLPMKIRGLGEFTHMHALAPFLKEQVLITAIVQSVALSGEVGVGSFHSGREGREEPTWQLQRLNSR